MFQNCNLTHTHTHTLTHICLFVYNYYAIYVSTKWLFKKNPYHKQLEGEFIILNSLFIVQCDNVAYTIWKV